MKEMIDFKLVGKLRYVQNKTLSQKVYILLKNGIVLKHAVF